MNKNTKIALGVGIAALVLLVVWAVASNKPAAPSSEGTPTTTTDGTTPAETTPTTTKPVVKPVVKKPGTAPVTKEAELSYNETVAKYDGSGYRMQFVSCGARPATMTVKRNVKFMLDNRDAKAHKIVIGKSTYNLAAYGWTVLSLPTAGKVNITCDGGGSGFIVVQS